MAEARDYDVMAVITYEGRVRATSARQAREIAEAANGRYPLDITDVAITAEVAPAPEVEGGAERG